MRSLAGSSSMVVMSLIILGCGGGAAPAAGASSPEGPGPSAAGPTDAGVSKTDDSTAPTTTLALGDGGDLQGSKLVETHTSAPAPAASADAAKPAHGHDVGRSPQDIRAIIQAHRDEARACYDAGVKDHPGIEGDLVIEWTIDPKGNVTQTSLNSAKSQIVEPTVVACVSDVIKKIQFNASAGGYETRAFYPFNFHPHHAGARPAP
jgi:hypothetical protein